MTAARPATAGTRKPANELASSGAIKLLFCCLLAQIFGNGMTSIYGFFVNPIAEEFGVGMSTMSMGLVIFLFTSAICSGVLGVILKPATVKPYMLSGSVLLAIGMLCLSRASSLPLIVLSMVLTSVAISFYALLPGTLLLTHKFNRFRGRAMAISAMGISFAGFILPPIAALLIEALGWRDALAIIGVASGAILFTCFSIGVQPPNRNDADADEKERRDDRGVAENANEKAMPSTDISPKQLFTDRRFWLIGAIFSLFYTTSLIMATYNTPYFLTLGMSNIDAAWLMVLGSVTGLTGKLIYGTLMDIFPRQLLLLLLSLQILPGVFWYLMGSIVEYDSMITPVVMAIMFFTGGTLPLQPYVNSRYFGAAAVSKATGLQSALVLPLSLIAMPLAGYVYDQVGNYQWVYFSCGIVLLVATIPTLMLRGSKEA